MQDTPAAASSKPEQEDDYDVAPEEDVGAAGTQDNAARRTESAVEEVKSIREVEEVTEVLEKQEAQVNEETPSKPLDTPLETSSDALAAKEAKPESHAEQAEAVQDTPAAASSKPEQEDDYDVAPEEDVGAAGTQDNAARRTESAVEEVKSIREVEEVTEVPEKQEAQVNEETPSKPLDTPLETSSDALAAKEAKPESHAEQAEAVQDTPAAASSKPEQEDDYDIAIQEDVGAAGTQDNAARRTESAVEEVKSIREVEEVTEVPEKQEAQVNEETPSKPLDTPLETSSDALAAKEAKPESHAEQAEAVQDTPAAASSKPEQEDDYDLAPEEDVGSAGAQDNAARRTESAVEEVKSIREVEEATEVPEKQEAQVNEETPSKLLDTPLETSSDALAAKEAKPESHAEQAEAVQDTPAAASSKPEQEDDYDVAPEEDVVSAGVQDNAARRTESAVEEVKSIREVEEVTEVSEKQEAQVNEETPSKPLDTPLETSSDALAAKEAKPESHAEQAEAVQDTPAAASSKPEQEDDYDVAPEEDVVSAGAQDNAARRTESAVEEVKSIREVEEVTEVPEKQEAQVNEETPSKPLDTPLETSSDALAAKEAKPESHAEQAEAVQDTPAAASSKPEQEDDYDVAPEEDVVSAGAQDNAARRTESAVEEVKSIREVEEVTEVPEKQEAQVNEETPSKPLDTPLETSSDALAAKEAKPESHAEQAEAVQDTPGGARSKPEQEDDYDIAIQEDVGSAGAQDNAARRTESAVEEVKSIREVEEVTEVPEKQEAQVNEETPSKPLDTPLETSSDALAAKEAKPESHAEQAEAVQDTPAAASSKPEQEDDYDIAIQEDVGAAGAQDNAARRTESAVEEVKSIREVEEVTEVPEKQEAQVNEETPSKPLDTPLETSSDALAAKEAKPESHAEQAEAVQDTPGGARSKHEQEDDYDIAIQEDVGAAGTQDNAARRAESAVEEVVSKEIGEVTPEEKPVFAQEDSGLSWMLSSEKATEDISTVDLHAASVLRAFSWSHFLCFQIASHRSFSFFLHPQPFNRSNTAPVVIVVFFFCPSLTQKNSAASWASSTCEEWDSYTVRAMLRWWLHSRKMSLKTSMSALSARQAQQMLEAPRCRLTSVQALHSKMTLGRKLLIYCICLDLVAMHLWDLGIAFICFGRSWIPKESNLKVRITSWFERQLELCISILALICEPWGCWGLWSRLRRWGIEQTPSLPGAVSTWTWSLALHFENGAR